MVYLEISRAPKIDLKCVAEVYQEPCQTSKMNRFGNYIFLNIVLYSVLSLTWPTGRDIEEVLHTVLPLT